MLFYLMAVKPTLVSLANNNVDWDWMYSLLIYRSDGVNKIANIVNTFYENVKFVLNIEQKIFVR